jgi:DNA-binding MarR family transcriptional regulator
MSWLIQRELAQLLEANCFCLTPPQFYTLLSLNNMTGACNMSDLACVTHQPAASLTGIIDRLVSKGFVTRSRHEQDRRQVLVQLTHEGHALVKVVMQAHMQQLVSLLANVNDMDVHALACQLGGVISQLHSSVHAVDHNGQHNGCH